MIPRCQPRQSVERCGERNKADIKVHIKCLCQNQKRGNSGNGLIWILQPRNPRLRFLQHSRKCRLIHFALFSDCLDLDGQPSPNFLFREGVAIFYTTGEAMKKLVLCRRQVAKSSLLDGGQIGAKLDHIGRVVLVFRASYLFQTARAARTRMDIGRNVVFQSARAFRS